MSSELDPYDFPMLLWHASPSRNRASILKDGLKPNREERRAAQLMRPIWFYNSAWHYSHALDSEWDADEVVGFTCAVEWSGFEVGTDFSFEGPEVVNLYGTVPPASILAHYPANTAASLPSLSEQIGGFLGRDWLEDLAARCLDPQREWIHQTSLASALLAFAPGSYRSSGVMTRLLGFASGRDRRRIASHRSVLADG
jgi:hypothetical protein